MKSQTIRNLVSSNFYPKNARQITPSCLFRMNSSTDSILILCPVVVFCYFVYAILNPFVVFYTFLCLFVAKTKIYTFSRWNCRKNYWKPINQHFSNYRQKYRYWFKISSNYRWFSEIIGKLIDVEIARKIIEKIIIIKKMTYCPPLPLKACTVYIVHCNNGTDKKTRFLTNVQNILFEYLELLWSQVVGGASYTHLPRHLHIRHRYCIHKICFIPNMPVQRPLSTLAMKRNNICTLHNLFDNYTWNSMLTAEGYGKDSDSRYTPEFDIQDSRPQTVYYANSGLLSTFGSFPDFQLLFL